MVNKRTLALGLIALVGFGLGACATGDRPEPEPTPPPAEAAPADDVDDSVEATAERLRAALAQSQTAGSGFDPAAGAARANQPSVAPTPATSNADPAASPSEPLPPEPAWDPLPSLSPRLLPAAAPAELTRAQMVDRLVAELAGETSEPMVRAMRGVGLRLFDPQAGELDAGLLAGLTPRQRQRIAGFEALVQALKLELASDRLAVDRDALYEQLEQALGPQPIEIRHIELARRVSGYGTYDPIDRRRFLAGQDHRFILYVELDHFRPAEQSDGEHEVKLEQEIVLYNEHDGLAVWRQQPVQIVDRSRNRRRDFFVVQMITLPQRLSVGRYLLKVRVTDIHGESLDERTEPIQIVADASLLDGDNPDE
ncbi:MAG: hypothetical protein WD316_07240 [Phycisphaeraceae bacterium]